MPRALRALAIVIALLGAIDPALSATRTDRPEVSVIAGGMPADRALAARVGDALEERFTVIPAPFAAAAATVIVGRTLPALATELASPVFAVAPAGDEASVSIDVVSAPTTAMLDARVPVVARTRTTGARGRALEATLHMRDVVVDRVTLPVASNDERTEVRLSLVPTAVGAVPLRIGVRIIAAADTASAGRGGGPGVQVSGTATSGGAADATADLLLDVRDSRWAVLFFDPRPSWLSTFVRRTVERDPRFVVTSRVVTSRNLSTDAGRPPSTLDDLAALSLFDAVIVGAPEALGARDVAGLEAYLRRRGGSVVLLLDDRAAGPYDRLTGARDWSTTSSSAGVDIRRVDGDSLGLRATSLAWPATLPAGAHPVAVSSGGSVASTAGSAPEAGVRAGSGPRPILWRTAVGAGQLTVSGALDAWRHRDPAQSAFEAFWRTILSNAAEASRAPLEVALRRTVLAPGERVAVSATLREASLAELGATRPVRATVAAAVESTGDAPGAPIPVRLWPAEAPGHLAGEFRTPAVPGAYRFVATSDGFRAEQPFLVLASPSPAWRDESDLITAWVESRGGETIAASALDDLVPALERAVKPVARRETWYPMRSAWWIVPFALLLGAEWLWRRRRGLA